MSSFPSSTFCFTTPILKHINEGGKAFTYQIPYQYVPYVVEITCLAFNDNCDSFEKFMAVLRGGVKAHFNSLSQNSFSALLQGILDETKQMTPKFFGSLDYATTIL